MFDLNDKVAVITGGASGIGLFYAKELLKNGVKGVSLLDVLETEGMKAVEEMEKEFGKGKAIFVKTDVTDMIQFEGALKQTVNIFKHVDILMNNAGILDDKNWEEEILLNVNGVVHGMLLGMDKYLSKYMKGDEAMIVNISSTAGIGKYTTPLPIYTGTKSAVLGMTKAWGKPYHYERTKVKVVAVCPGITMTKLITDMSGKNLGPVYQKWIDENWKSLPTQEPLHLAEEMMMVMKKAKNGTVWVIEGGEPAYEFDWMMDESETMKMM